MSDEKKQATSQEEAVDETAKEQMAPEDQSGDGQKEKAKQEGPEKGGNGFHAAPMKPGPPAKTVRVTIDGRSMDAPEGAMVLDVARAAGIEVPSLCAHPGLEPFGACRLCVVEVRKHGWDEDWRKLVTSCLYPVEEGLIVYTRSDEVMANRKVVLDLQLARVPASPEIRQLAAEYGIHDTSYEKRDTDDTCIMCTLCVRACDAVGAFAIATLDRGPDKYVDVPDIDACIGCGACARICPTNAIPMEETAEYRRIWGKQFEMVEDESGRPVNTPEMLEHFQQRSGLPEHYFTKNDWTRKRETAASFVRVQFD